MHRTARPTVSAVVARRVLLASVAAAFAAGATACGPDPADIDRSPVAGMTEENPTPGVVGEGAARPAGARHRGELGLTEPALEAAAEVECGPFASEAAAPGGAGMRIALRPAGAEGTRVVVTIPDFHGDGEYEARLVVERVGEDGVHHESTGNARVSVEQGRVVAADAATHHLTGRFAGSYGGEAGSGDARGSFRSCLYFE
jgi:hypothetical protein